jgi:MoaD family protein
MPQPQNKPANVTVKLFGGPRDVAGTSEISLAVAGAPPTISDLLNELARRFPQLYEALRQGLKEGYVTLLLNGRNVRFLDGFQTPLVAGAVIAFLPPVGGG